MDLRFLNEAFNNSEDILLYRGDTVRMGEHFVHYRDKRQEGVNLYYDMDYFTVEPRNYQAGDTVRVGDMLFRAKAAHQAGEVLLGRPARTLGTLETFHETGLVARTGMEFHPHPAHRCSNWHPSCSSIRASATWPNPAQNIGRTATCTPTCGTPTSTMASDTADDTWMPDRLYDKHVGDTIITPTALAIIDSVTYRAGQRDQADAGRALHGVCRASAGPRPVPARPLVRGRPLVIYADGQPVSVEGRRIGRPAGTVRSRHGGWRRTLWAMAVRSPEPVRVKIGLNVAEAEFVVMQAIVFPGINILWIGCVLLFLGLGMAVWQRVKGTSEDQVE